MTNKKSITALVLILLVTLALRVPSFFEPLWYGDEGISLTVAQAIRGGALLYRDIHDNKPPLFYFLLAICPTLLWARILATICVLSTQVVIFFLARKLFSEKLQALGAALLFGIFASLPLLEGNIANGEILMVLPASLAMFWGLYWKKWGMFGAGVLFGLASLLKVPAAFDFLALLVFNFLFSDEAKPLLKLCLGFSLPWTLVLGFFAAHCALGDFCFSVFLYNLRYVGVGEGLFPSGVKIGLFALLPLLVFLFWKFKSKLSHPFKFLALWFLFSLFGALLSGRPYPHYLVQALPPLTLLIILCFSKFSSRERVLSFSLAALYFTLFAFLPFYRYPLFSYWQNFSDYVRGRKPLKEYRNFFDSRVGREYEIAQYVRENTESDEKILVWGDEPGIYTLSRRPPAIKFVANYHIDAARAWEGVESDLFKTPPALVILISRGEKLSPEFWEKYDLAKEVDGAEIFAR